MATYLFDGNKNLVDKNSDIDKYGFDDVKNKILFNKQEGVYGIDEYKNFIEIKTTVGDTVILDGIECVCICDNPYLFVDKNHDLSYYVKGSDYVNSGDYDQSPGTYGYEWGGYEIEIETGIQDTSVGAGLSNTNALIGMNLQSDTLDWWVVWDKVNEFRQSHSDKWFVPSKDELYLVYLQRGKLNNLSSTLEGYCYYWSSSERSPGFAYGYLFTNVGFSDRFNKNIHYLRTRLCRTL